MSRCRSGRRLPLIPSCGLGLDGLRGRHQLGPAAARRVHDPEPAHRVEVRPVGEVVGQGEPGEHDGRKVVRVERGLALRRPEDAVVERVGVVVPERPERLRELSASLVEFGDRGLGDGAVADRLQHGERRPEHGRVVALENALPRLLQLVLRTLGPAHAVQAQQHRSFGISRNRCCSRQALARIRVPVRHTP